MGLDSKWPVMMTYKICAQLLLSTRISPHDNFFRCCIVSTAHYLLLSVHLRVAVYIRDPDSADPSHMRMASFARVRALQHISSAVNGTVGLFSLQTL